MKRYTRWSHRLPANWSMTYRSAICITVRTGLIKGVRQPSECLLRESSIIHLPWYSNSCRLPSFFTNFVRASRLVLVAQMARISSFERWLLHLCSSLSFVPLYLMFVATILTLTWSILSLVVQMERHTRLCLFHQALNLLLRPLSYLGRHFLVFAPNFPAVNTRLSPMVTQILPSSAHSSVLAVEVREHREKNNYVVERCSHGVLSLVGFLSAPLSRLCYS
jgi:hypothetical protein